MTKEKRVYEIYICTRKYTGWQKVRNEIIENVDFLLDVKAKDRLEARLYDKTVIIKRLTDDDVRGKRGYVLKTCHMNGTSYNYLKKSGVKISSYSVKEFIEILREIWRKE